MTACSPGEYVTEIVNLSITGEPGTYDVTFVGTNTVVSAPFDTLT
jgi:hypothetical protein